jgi:uncharacterized OB-fold protein
MSDNAKGVLAQHQAFLDEGRFMVQHCKGCDQHIYFPREVCPHCGSGDLALVAPTGLGTVYSVTTVRRKPDAGGDYNVCLIDLDEGVRLMSQPRPIRSVHRSEGWTPQSVLDQAMPALKSSFFDLERSGDVFSWDPI